jgi:hypothetical protein
MANFTDGRSAPDANESTDTGQPTAPQTPQAPQAPAPEQNQPQQPAGKIQDDPVFQSLPRDIQKQVESGMPLDQAVQLAAKAGGGAGAPAPNADNNPTTPLNQGPSPDAGRQAVPNTPNQFGSGADRLSAGTVLEGGRTGRDTFARPGSQGFKSFSGQEFNPFLLRPEAAGGAAISARDALQSGDAGRQIAGGGGGYSLGGGNDPFLKDVIGS